MERPDIELRVVDSQRTIDQLLYQHKSSLGADYDKYRNHVYRVFNYAWALRGYLPHEEEKIAIAAVFHDLGIFTDRTFDYLEPSVQRMRLYLLDTEQEDLQEEIATMIYMHHKATSYKGAYNENVEAFRKADACDLSLGVMNYGIPRKLTTQLHKKFKNEGFHLRLLQEGARNFLKSPLRPLPMFKW